MKPSRFSWGGYTMNKTNENNRELKRTQQNSTPNIRWMLVGYDLIVYAVVAIILLVIYGGMDKLSSTGILQQVCLSALCILQHVFWVKSMDRYGDMVESSAISVCYLPTLSLL